MMALAFLILHGLGYVDTKYDWLLFALFYIGDQVSGISSRLYERFSEL